MKPAMNSRRAGAVSPVLVILILCISGVGLLGTFWWMGDISLPALDHLRDGPSAEATHHDGKIAVPVAAREISAYRKVRRDDFWLPETQEFASVWLDEEVAAERGIMTAKEVLNRVLAVDKKKGYAFSEDDFLPVGTREGPAAGIEPGMRGLRVSAESIAGLHGLRRGDRFDLIATQSVEKKSNGRDSEVSPLAKAAHSEDESWDVSTRIIVQNGKLVEPIRARQSLASNAGRNSRVEEAFLGIAEDEITRLTEALALGAKILCVPRSALPGAGESDLMARARPAGPGVVEVYSKGKRSLTYVPRGRDYTDRYEPDFYMDDEEWADVQVAAVDSDVQEAEAAVLDESIEPEVDEALIAEVALVEAAYVENEPEPELIDSSSGIADAIARVEVGEVAEEPAVIEVAVEAAVAEVEAPITAIAEPVMATEELTVMDAIVAQELGSEVANAGRFLGLAEVEASVPSAPIAAEASAADVELPSQMLEDPTPVVADSESLEASSGEYVEAESLSEKVETVAVEEVVTSMEPVTPEPSQQVITSEPTTILAEQEPALTLEPDSASMDTVVPVVDPVANEMESPAMPLPTIISEATTNAVGTELPVSPETAPTEAVVPANTPVFESESQAAPDISTPPEPTITAETTPNAIEPQLPVESEPEAAEAVAPANMPAVETAVAEAEVASGTPGVESQSPVTPAPPLPVETPDEAPTVDEPELPVSGDSPSVSTELAAPENAPSIEPVVVEAEQETVTPAIDPPVVEPEEVEAPVVTESPVEPEPVPEVGDGKFEQGN